MARLTGLPQEDGLLEQIVEKIGPVRESNFGREYQLEIKDIPDSSAYTARALLQHIDMPTRERPHGLQLRIPSAVVWGIRCTFPLRRHNAPRLKNVNIH